MATLESISALPGRSSLYFDREVPSIHPSVTPLPHHAGGLKPGGLTEFPLHLDSVKKKVKQGLKYYC